VTEQLPRQRPSLRPRLLAVLALALAVATVVLSIVFVVRHVGYLLGALALLAVSLSAAWLAATDRRWRVGALVLGLVCLAGAVVCVLASDARLAAPFLIVASALASAAAGSLALRDEVQDRLRRRWRPAPAVHRGVVFMNPRSGGGKVERLHLVEEAERRGVRAVVLGPRDDLRALAESAADDGADALGAAGGDGTQAIVADVAARHGLAFVCVPAGTRNHLALDLGIDREDPVGALDAFGAARQAPIDLGRVNGRVFVNNVSLGVYAQIVSSDAYRDAKRQTVAKTLPDVFGPDAPPFDLSLDGPTGPMSGMQVVQVSNNPYVLTSMAGFGSRPRLDGGVLGVATLKLERAADISRLAMYEAAGRPQRYSGWHEWSTAHLEVRSGAPVAAAIDGESTQLEAPVSFAIEPGAVVTRIAEHQSGASPALERMAVRSSTLVGLVRIVIGRPSGVVSAIALADRDDDAPDSQVEAGRP
jgi:diacylglycerol kinase family enzyme